MIKIMPLFSGSRGNCALIQTERANVLLDAGYRYKSTVDELRERGLSLRDISAIIITHEHSDHVATLPYITRNYHLPLYAPAKICDYVSQISCCPNVLSSDDGVQVQDIVIDSYVCSHDARACLGYRFTCGNDSIAVVSDTGCYDDRLIEFLYPCATVQLESNHDVDMLINGNYPYPLKRRILSNSGHLSNAQNAEILTKLKGSALRNVVLSHLSEQNNTKEIAFDTAVNALRNVGLVEGKDVSVYVADQYKNGIIC